MIHSNPPRCPVHVSAEMELVNSASPLFVFVSIHDKRHFRSIRKKHAESRMIWRCPIPGCSRVEASDIVNPWERFELAGQK